MNSEFLAQARAYKNELIARLFGQPESSPTETEKLSILQAIPEGSNIVGVGFGHKVTQGSIAREEPVIRVYVRAKLLESELSEKMKIPKEINGIPTDVIEVGEVNPHSTPCGVSVSHQSGKPGTIGCLVRKTDWLALWSLVPASQTPPSFSLTKALRRLLACTMGRLSAAPTATLRTVSLTGEEFLRVVMTKAQPAHSAVRRHAPRLWGSWTPSRTRISGSLCRASKPGMSASSSKRTGLRRSA